MKFLIKNLAMFGVLAFVFSNLGCTSSNSTAEVPSGLNNSATEKTAKKTSDYPALSEAISTADFKAVSGETWKIKDRKGTALLLNMWATWCGPCREEMPTLVELHEKYKANGFEVVGLNTDDETEEDIAKFVAEMKLTYPIVWADAKTQAEFLKISRFDGIPQSFLIDKDGHLRAHFRGASPDEIAKMKTEVDKLMKES